MCGGGEPTLTTKQKTMKALAGAWSAFDFLMYIPHFAFKNKARYYIEQDDLTKSSAEA